MKSAAVVSAAAFGLLLSCASDSSNGHTAAETDLRPALDAITAAGLLGHIKTLSSDQFEGRSPGSHGEDLTVAYLTDQFKKMGLKSGNPDGTYIQKVPLVGYTSNVRTDITAKGRKLALTGRADFVAASRRYAAEVKV